MSRLGQQTGLVHTLVALHNDPYSAADAFVDQLWYNVNCVHPDLEIGYAVPNGSSVEAIVVMRCGDQE